MVARAPKPPSRRPHRLVVFPPPNPFYARRSWKRREEEGEREGAELTDTGEVLARTLATGAWCGQVRVRRLTDKQHSRPLRWSISVQENNSALLSLLSIDDRAVVVSIRFSGAHILCCSCVFPVPEN